jgi:hypothetical protein
LHTFFAVAQFCKRRVYFLYLLHKESQKGDKLKNPAAEQAVPCKAALSGVKPATDRARLVSLASRQGRHRKELFNLPQLTNKC